MNRAIVAPPASRRTFVGAPDAFEVHLTGPLDVAASLEFYRRNGDDLLDRWDGTHFVRAVPVGKEHVAVACRPTGTVEAPRLAVEVGDSRYRDDILSGLPAVFVAAPAEFEDLVRADPLIARLHARYPGLRPVLQPDLLGALVRCISAQQVNLRWAATTRRRLAERFGRRHRVGAHTARSLSAGRLARAKVDEIRALQFTTRKAEYIVGVAREIAAGSLARTALARLADADVIARLTGMRGIGLWTAEWILARTLGRARVVAGGRPFQPSPSS